MTRIARRTFMAMAAGSLAIATLPTAAQNFPNKTVRFIVPFPAGGFSDAITRYYADKLSAQWKQPVIVENRAGANGTLGTGAVAKADADGHTLVFTNATINTLQALGAPAPYEVSKDLTPILTLGATTNLIVVKPDSPYRSLRDLVDAARRAPGKISYASAQIGSGGHLVMAILEEATGVTFNHIPYKGAAPSMLATMSGEVDFGASSVSGSLAQINAGKLRALAVNGDTRSSLLPQVPTFAEAGFPEVGTKKAWLGVLGPGSMPDALVQRLYGDFRAVRDLPESAEVLRKYGLEADPTTPQEFRARILTELKDYTAVVRAKGIKAE